MKAISVLNELFNRAWEESAVKPLSRKFALKYISKLNEFNKIQILKDSLQKFSKIDVESLWLCLPELWEQMNLKEWVTLMKNISPRPHFTIFDPTGSYADIIFFVKWLNLDIVKFILSLNDIPISDKQKICLYCYANACFLQPDPEDFDEFDDETFCSFDSLIQYRHKLLLEDNNLVPVYENEDEFRNYIINLHFDYFGTDIE